MAVHGGVAKMAQGAGPHRLRTRVEGLRSRRERGINTGMRQDAEVWTEAAFLARGGAGRTLPQGRRWKLVGEGLRWRRSASRGGFDRDLTCPRIALMRSGRLTDPAIPITRPLDLRRRGRLAVSQSLGPWSRARTTPRLSFGFRGGMGGLYQGPRVWGPHIAPKRRTARPSGALQAKPS